MKTALTYPVQHTSVALYILTRFFAKCQTVFPDFMRETRRQVWSSPGAVTWSSYILKENKIKNVSQKGHSIKTVVCNYISHSILVNLQCTCTCASWLVWISPSGRCYLYDWLFFMVVYSTANVTLQNLNFYLNKCQLFHTCCSSEDTL